MKYPLVPRTVAPPQLHEPSVPTVQSNTLAIPSGPYPQEVTDDMVLAARSLRPSAVIKLARVYYPRISRMAIALCGDDKLGHVALRKVLLKSLQFMPKWEDATQATNWFLHYTIIVTREKGGITLDPNHDCLTRRMSDPPTQYIAFVRAVRLMDHRHREALLLALGEQLDHRQAAIAMDSSTTAVSTHMEGANELLTPIAGRDFDALFSSLQKVYTALTPTQKMTDSDMAWLSLHLTGRRSVGLIRKLIALGLLALIVWGLWKIAKLVMI